MIKFDGVIVDGGIGPLTFEVRAGETAKVIAGSDEDREDFIDVLLGLRRPGAGSVHHLGKDIYSISDAGYIKLFRRVGVVPESGGLISNLKVWENIALPVSYHGARGARVLKESESRAAEIFADIGLAGDSLKALMGRLPGPLSSYEKKLIGLVRAMLMEPEIMIYDSLFDGLSPEFRDKLLRLTGKFNEGRASVYISSNALSLDGVSAGLTIDLSSLGEAKA